MIFKANYQNYLKKNAQKKSLDKQILALSKTRGNLDVLEFVKRLIPVRLHIVPLQ